LNESELRTHTPYIDVHNTGTQ